jgi:hypothetical protein
MSKTRFDRDALFHARKQREPLSRSNDSSMISLSPITEDLCDETDEMSEFVEQGLPSPKFARNAKGSGLLGFVSFGSHGEEHEISR